MIQEYQDGPLHHIKVLDLTDEKGHLCGKYLADLGAQVIKVEPPAGDLLRYKGPFFHDVPNIESSLLWLSNNTKKKSITLNLTNPIGCQLFKKLVRKTDLVIESFPPGQLGTLGINFQTLEKENKRIVVTSITPFGQTGPYASYKGSDLTILAMSGFMFTCGDSDRPPVRISVGQVYSAAGVQAASASLLALRYCQQTNRSQHIDVAMRECMPHGGFETFFWEIEGYVGERLGVRRRRANIYIRDLWPCRDGYIGFRLMVGSLGARTIYNLVEWMDNEGRAGELKEIKWETIDMIKITQEQMERWENIIIRFLKKHTKAEIYEKALKKEMLMSPSFNIPEVLAYSQLNERNFWDKSEHPKLKKTITYPGAFCRMSDSPLSSVQRAPFLGEHNREIYCEELGLSEDKINQFSKIGIL